MTMQKMAQRSEADVLVLPSGELLWHANNGKPPKAATPAVAAHSCKPFEKVRVLGNASAAEFICRLFELYGPEGDKQIFLGSPGLVRDQLASGTPQAVFKRYETLRIAPSLGGWRRMTALDHGVYHFLWRLAKHGAEHTQVSQAMAAHPAFRICRFLADYNVCYWSAMVQLVGRIVDPRWHIDPRFPNSQRRLNFAVGLYPRAVKTFLETRAGTGESALAAVLDAAFLGPTDQLRDPPRDFLLRYFHSQEGTRQAHLRWIDTCRVGVQTIVAHWLEVVSNQNLFVPEHLFACLPDAKDVVGVCRVRLNQSCT